MEIGKQEGARDEAELWRQVPGWPDYEVSSFGRLYNKRTSRFPLSLHSSLTGARLSAAEAVLRAFFGPPPTPGARPRFKDKNNKNLYWANLLWASSDEARFTAQSRVTPENREEIEQRLRAGNETYEEIAADYRISFKLVAYYAKRLGISRKFAVLEGTEAKVLELLNTDKSYAEIGEIVGVSKSLVHQIAKKNNTSRGMKYFTPIVSDEKRLLICMRVLDGVTYQEIAKEFDVSRATVGRVFREFIATRLFKRILQWLAKTKDYQYIHEKTNADVNLIAKIDKKFKPISDVRHHHFRPNPLDEEIRDLEQQLATGDESARDPLIKALLRSGVPVNSQKILCLIEPYEEQMLYDFGSRYEYQKPEDQRSPVLLHPIADIDYGQYFGKTAGGYDFFKKWGFKYDPTLTIVNSRVENAPYILEQAKLRNYISSESNDPNLPSKKAFNGIYETLQRMNADNLGGCETSFPPTNNHRGNHRIKTSHGDIDVLYKLWRIPSGYLMQYWNLSIDYNGNTIAVNAMHFFRRDGFGAPNYD